MKLVSTGKGIHSPGFYKKKLKRKKLKRIFAASGTLLLLLLAIFTLRQDRLLIKEVSVPGEDVVGKDEVVADVESLLAGSYMWILPRASAFIYPEDEIVASITEKFPRFKSVELDLEGMSKLNVLVEEREPFALYCIEEDECYFLDNEGFVFALAPSFSDGVYYIYRSDMPRESIYGHLFQTSGEFARIREFIKSLGEIGIHSKELSIGEDEYSLLLPGGARIVWLREADLGTIYSNLEAFISSEAIRSQGNFLDKITILDLRTANKIFYKFKEIE